MCFFSFSFEGHAHAIYCAYFLLVFERQIRCAVEKVRKPLVVHSRQAESDTYDMLKKHMPSDWPVHVCLILLKGHLLPLFRGLLNVLVLAFVFVEG